MADFLASTPWSVESEPGPNPNQTAFRLRVWRPVPVDLITVVGDAVHNMRSSLDAVAYELARRHVGGPLSDRQEQATQFPITKNLGAFRHFFQQSQRRHLYGTKEINALKCVQPFALDDEARERGIDVGRSDDLSYRTDELYRLHRVSLVDKHRRLPLVAWFPRLVYWSSPTNRGQRFNWSPHTVPTMTFEDGTLLGYLTDSDGTAAPTAEVFHDMCLTLIDDPAFRRDLVEVLDNWHGHLHRWVLPRIFNVAEGNPPPLGFTTA